MLQLWRGFLPPLLSLRHYLLGLCRSALGFRRSHFHATDQRPHRHLQEHFYNLCNILGPDLPIQIVTTTIILPAKTSSNATWHHRTDPHVLASYVLHHGFGESGQAKLRSVICRTPGERIRSRQAVYIDDVTPASSNESEQSFTTAVKCAAEIRINSRLPVFQRKIGDGTEDANTGVINEYVQPAEADVDKPEQVANLFMTLNIGSFPGDFTAGFRSQFPHRGIDRLLFPAANRHHCPFREQHLGDSPPDSARPAGNPAHRVWEARAASRTC